MKDQKAHWRVLTPTTWPDPPAEMSVSTHAEIDECPRRWALGAAEYPDIWSGRGYPPKLQAAALAGSVVHLALELITKQLTRAGVPSLNDPSATQVLRELGGYTRVVEDCAERVLKRFSDNPRALPLMEHAQRTLRGQLPTLRARVQSMLARLRLPKRAPPAPTTSAVKTAEPPPRSPLANGTYPEVEVRAKSIGWKGKVDLLVLGDDACEIADFKTGAADEAHKFQVQIYALLWSLDGELNPARRLVDRLVLAYEGGDVDVAPPRVDELSKLEKDLVDRRAAAEAALSARPPEARPRPETCRHCEVRQLCDKYWAADSFPKALDQRFSDVELKILRRHGPSSWDAVVVLSSLVDVGKPALLRTQQPGVLQLGTRFRVLDGAVTVDREDHAQPVIVTLGMSSEIFAVTEPRAGVGRTEGSPAALE